MVTGKNTPRGQQTSYFVYYSINWSMVTCQGSTHLELLFVFLGFEAIAAFRSVALSLL